MYTAATAFLEALQEAGVSYIFANLGSDHPPIIEAIAEAKVSGRTFPQLITCPNEMVALSAAHGYAQITGRAQAVVIHVECGTQALGGAVHNAAKGRAPVLIFAGASPYTQEGELKGSRNEFIQWLQDVHDQRGLVRGYMRYDAEIRTGVNIKQLVHRSMQFAHSDPKGPVYLMAAREVLEAEVQPVSIDTAQWQPISPAAAAPDRVEELAAALATARRPLVVTSYLGRNPRAVAELQALAGRIGVGVMDSVPYTLNFPADDPLYQGVQWGETAPNPTLQDADVVVVIDSDIPWIPLVNKPHPDARVFHIDVDPLKDQIPLWYIPAQRVFRADAATVLAQVNACLEGMRLDAALVEERKRHYGERHQARLAMLKSREAPRPEVVTIEYLAARLREHLDADTIVMSEGITNYKPIAEHLGMTRPGSYFASGGGSLGWNGGAAIGAKLAAPDKTFVAITGDGSYMFSVPSTVHWMARRYNTPFLQVVLNNRGWRGPKFSTLAVHPDGFASRSDDLGIAFDPPPDYAGIAAAAGGALALTVRRPEEVDAALARGLKAVREEGRSAVVDVWLEHL